MNQELGYFGIPDSLADTAYLAAALLAALPEAHPLRSTWLTRIADGGLKFEPSGPAVHRADRGRTRSCGLPPAVPAVGGAVAAVVVAKRAVVGVALPAEVVAITRT